MPIRYIAKSWFIPLLLCISTAAHAQNLVPNHSFEILSACPATYGTTGLSLAPPWTAPTWGTPDLFNVCATNPQFGVPSNYVGYQYAFEGDGYFGMICYGGSDVREYLQAPLNETLVAGNWYYVSFLLNVANNGCGINKFGAYFSSTAPSSNNGFPLNVDPQINANQGIMNDTAGWELVAGCFQAAGGEAFITLGNFFSDAETAIDPGCTTSVGYFLIDYVVVELGSEPEEISFDLGGPEEACFEYEIDPGISGYTLIWEDGSTGPTLVVTESGSYALTVTDGCNFGVDSIEVTIIPEIDALDIGPESVTLCDGETFNISLDPDLGDYEWQDGSNDPDYIISASGIYSVTVSNGCDEAMDIIEVTALHTPEPIDLGADTYLCDGDEITFSFDPSLGEFTWQDNSTGPDFTATYSGTYSVTISNACGDQSDQIVLTPLAIPEIELGPALDTLCAGEILQYEFDEALGDFFWQDGSSNNFYQITTPGTYTLFVTNECGTGGDQIDVVFFDSPTFDFGPDLILCLNAQVTLNANNIAGAYLWQDGSIGSSYVVTQPGTYALTVSTGCGIDNDTIVIDYTDTLHAPDLGADVSLCPGEQFTLYATTAGATYAWQDMSTADSLIISTAGTYHVTVSNACESFSDTIVVTLQNSSPTVDLPASLSLCEGDTIILEANVTAVQYLWNDASTLSSLIVTTPGSYSVTISNSCGMDVDTAQVIDLGPAPAVELGNDISFCPGESIMVTPLYSNVDIWQWQDGSTDTTFVVTTAGIVSVTASNICGIAYDTLMATQLPATPPFDLGNDTSLCSGEMITLEIQVADVSITWFDGSSASQLAITSPGTYVASIANACGANTDTVIVGSLPPVPWLNLGPDQSLCPGEVIILDPGISNVSYEWHDGSTASTFLTTQPGLITLTISNACGTSIDSLQVVESTDGPQVHLGNDIGGCAGDTVVIASGIAGVSYVWHDGSTGSSFVTNVSGQIILHVSNNCGSDADTILVDLSGVAPAVDLGVDTLLCDDETITVNVAVPPGTAIVWQDGSTFASYNINTAGSFHVTLENNCGIASDTMDVEYMHAPLPFTLGADTVLCAGESIVLHAPITSDMIQWQDGASSNSFIADQHQLYSLQIANQCGTAYDELTVALIDESFALDLDSILIWCPQQVIVYDVQQPFSATYQWSTGNITPSITITQPGTYAITIQTKCTSAHDSFEVILDDSCFPKTTYYIPNVFSPNGDGINDVFTVQFNADTDVISMEGTIYDRWGNVLFASSDYPFTWNGTRNDQFMNPGVYVYRFRLEYSNAINIVTEIITGDITLMR